MATTDSRDVAGDADDQRHIFPFFDLPPELRDEIYDLSFISYDDYLDTGPEILATDIAATNLLLVSKMFKHEYQLRAEKKSHLTMSDHEGWTPEFDPTLPFPARRFHRVKAQLVYDGPSVPEYHDVWLSKLIASLIQPSILTVRVNYLARCTDWDEIEAHIQALTKLTGLKDLKVCRRDNRSNEWSFETEEGLEWVWSSTTGKLEKVLAEEDDKEKED